MLITSRANHSRAYSCEFTTTDSSYFSYRNWRSPSSHVSKHIWFVRSHRYHVLFLKKTTAILIYECAKNMIIETWYRGMHNTYIYFRHNFYIFNLTTKASVIGHNWTQKDAMGFEFFCMKIHYYNVNAACSSHDIL